MPSPGATGAAVLRFGYSADDIDRFTRTALKADYATLGLDADDRRETAWYGVVERLYSAQDAPEPQELVHAGRKALYVMRSDEMQTRGRRPRSGCELPGTTPGFARYWLGDATSSPNEPAFVTAIVDCTALDQIFGRLSRPQREALLALALHRDYERAGTALGLSKPAFSSRLDRAREAFLALWHQDETPRPRPDDHRARCTLRPRVQAALDQGRIPSCAAVLEHARAVFNEHQAVRMFSGMLLSWLALDHPDVYDAWDVWDLADAMRVSGAPSRQITIGGEKGRGYLRSDLDQATQPGQAGGQDPCAVVLAAWLERERPPARDPRGEMLRHIVEAGPDGIALGQLARLMDRGSSTLLPWLRQEEGTGTITRLPGWRGRYASTQYVAPAGIQREPLPDDHPRAQMLRLLAERGPEGITTGALAGRLAAPYHTVVRWLCEECAYGAVVRVARGRYTAAVPAAVPASTAA